LDWYIIFFSESKRIKMGIVQKQGFSTTIFSYIGAAIGFLNRVLLFPRCMDTSMVGLTNLLPNMGAVYAQFASLSVPNITLKFMPMFKDDNKAHNGAFFWGNAITISGFLLSTLLLMVLKEPIIAFYSPKSALLVEYFYYLIPIGLATTLYNFYDNFLRSLYRTVFTTFVYEIVLRVCITASVLMFAGGWMSFRLFVDIYVAVNCLPAVVVLIYIIRIGEFHVKPFTSKIAFRLRKIILSFAAFSYLSALSLVFLNYIDAMLVAGWLGLGQAGIYTTILVVVSIISIPYRSMGKISAPIVSEFVRNKEMVKLEDIYKKFASNNLIISGLIFLLIAVNVNSIFVILPKAYSAGAFVLIVLGIARLFDAYTGLNGFILIVSGKYRYDLLFTLLLVVFTIGFNYFLIPRYGLNGAAMASAITIFLYNIGRLLAVLIFFKIHPFGKKDMVVVGLGLSVLFINWLFADTLFNIYVDSVVRSILVVIIFVFPIYYFKISSDFNQMLNHVIGKLMNKKHS